MKTAIIKLTGTAALFIALTMSCENIPNVTPVPNSTSSNLNANFLFVNASPDASALDFYVNNEALFTGITLGGATAYQNVVVTTNVGSNTRLNVKAPSGTIGGTLGSNDLIFRSTNTGVGNFAAANGGNYTVIVVDTISRPKPLRTANSLGFGDVTYYAPVTSFKGKTSANADTVIQLSPDYNNSIVTFNLCKKYNNNVAPSFFVALGAATVPIPLGATDPGGLRFLVLTDGAFPTPAAGKFAGRFINAAPDASSASCTISTAAPTTVPGQTTYPLSVASSQTVWQPVAPIISLLK